MTNNKPRIKDTVTGMSGEIVDVSAASGPLKVFIRLDNDELITRKISQITYIEDEGGEKK